MAPSMPSRRRRGDPPPLPPAARDLLIAVNTLDIHRPVVAILARELARWSTHQGPPEPLAAALGIPSRSLVRALDLRAEAANIAGRERERAAAFGAAIDTLGDPGYPPALAALPLAPPVIYRRGTLPSSPGVAIVGARNPSPYGREAATLFARDLAAAGATIVSGFARGIDTAAHEGALLAAGGRTVAVLGCGLDVDYPRGSRPLAERIAEHGAVLSELAFGWPPRAHQFPLRNRLIAALSLGTLVVEARLGSGSLITVRHALDLGREVWVIPGRIFDELALGPNSLARDGATPVLHPRHVRETLADLAPQLRLPLSPPTDTTATVVDAARPRGPLPASASLADRLLALLVPGDPQPPELLAEATAAGIDVTLVALLELELAGAVERLPGPLYHRPFDVRARPLAGGRGALADAELAPSASERAPPSPVARAGDTGRFVE